MNISTNVNINFPRISRKSYKKAMNLRENVINELAREYHLKTGHKNYLHELSLVTDKLYYSLVSQNYLADKLNCSISTIKRYEKYFNKLGWIHSTPRDINNTNRKEFIKLKNILCKVGVKMVPEPILPKGNINTCTVPLAAPSDKCAGAKPEQDIVVKPKMPKGHIYTERLNSDDEMQIQNEVRRAGEAAGLTNAQILYCGIDLKQSHGVRNRGAYLRAMMNGLKEGTWKMIKNTMSMSDYAKGKSKPNFEEQTISHKELMRKEAEQREKMAEAEQAATILLERTGIIKPLKDNYDNARDYLDAYHQYGRKRDYYANEILAGRMELR